MGPGIHRWCGFVYQGKHQRMHFGRKITSGGKSDVLLEKGRLAERDCESYVILFRTLLKLQHHHQRISRCQFAAHNRAGGLMTGTPIVRRMALSIHCIGRTPRFAARFTQNKRTWLRRPTKHIPPTILALYWKLAIFLFQISHDRIYRA